MIKKTIRKNKELRHIRLMLTERCNLNCSYCYLKSKNQEDMQKETAIKSLNLLLSSKGDYKEVYFFGGEPLLRFNMIQEVVLSAEELKPKYNKRVAYEINTNGLLLDENMLNFFRKFDLRIALSIDGRKDCFIGIRGDSLTYEKIISNLKMALRLNKEQVRIRMTIHPTKAEDLFANFNYMYGLGVTKIAVGPVQGVMWTDRQIRHYIENLRFVVSFFLDKIRSGETFYVTFISEYLDSLLREDKERALCYMGEGLNVEVDGNFTACSYCSQLSKSEDLKELMSIGNVDTGVDNKKRMFFLNYLLCKEYNLNCRECSPLLCNHICFAYSPDGQKYPKELMENHYKVRKAMYLVVKEMLRTLLSNKEYDTLRRIISISRNMSVKNFSNSKG